MNRISVLIAAGALAMYASVALAQKPAVYPAKGQTAEQKKKDDAACMSWAKQDTGIDPAAASQPAPQKTGPAVGGGERLKGRRAARSSAVSPAMPVPVRLSAPWWAARRRAGISKHRISRPSSSNSRPWPRTTRPTARAWKGAATR
jgi:hypothetical protein